MLKKKLGLEAIERSWFGFRCLKNYFRIPSSIITPEGCKRVGYRAFLGCDWLKKVEVPRSVRVIEAYAFWGCKNATITLKKPKKEFKYISPDAFGDCRYVEEEI